MINSTSNRQVKNLIQLQTKAKARKEQGLFVAEGVRMFREVPRELLVKIYVSESFYQREQNRALLAVGSARAASDGAAAADCAGTIPDGAAAASGAGILPDGAAAGSVEVLSDEVFARVSDTKTPQGILCVIRQREYSFADLFAGDAPFLLLLEQIQDPGNLGTIFRTAEAAGVSGLVLGGCADIYNPKTIRSTMGAVYRVPFVCVDSFEEVLRELRTRKIRTYAAHLRGEQGYTAMDYRKGCAFMIGNEGNGLSEDLAGQADSYIKIPMCGQAESLNAAVTAAVLMYEVRRQRDL